MTDIVYTPTVEATNANGVTLVQRQSLRITTGIPLPPEEPMFEELGDGNLRITVPRPLSLHVTGQCAGDEDVHTSYCIVGSAWFTPVL